MILGIFTPNRKQQGNYRKSEIRQENRPFVFLESEINMADYIRQMDKIKLFEWTDRKSCSEIGFNAGTLYAEILDGCLCITYSSTVMACTPAHNSNVINYYFDKDNTKRFITALTGVEKDFSKALSYHFNGQGWHKKLRELCENNIIEYRRKTNCH